jgi:putative transposase
LAERREVINLVLKQNPSAKVKQVCRFAEFCRTQFYYSKRCNNIKSPGRPVPGFTINRDGNIIQDTEIIERLKNYRSEIHFMNAGGSRILSHYLAQEHRIFVNHKKVYRLCRENNLLLYSAQTVKMKIAKKRCEYTEIKGPNQLWQFDLKYIFIHGENAWCYLLSFIDVFTKKVIAYTTGKSIKAGQLMVTLHSALVSESITPEHGLKIRSDNGPQMSSNRFHFYLKKLEQKLKHEFIPPRTPNRNAYIEAFFSIFEQTVIEVRYFKNFAEVYKAVYEFVEFYNNRRLHGSLGNMSPIQFIEKFKNGVITNYRISA